LMTTAWERELESWHNSVDSGIQLETTGGVAIDPNDVDPDTALTEAANMLIDLKLKSGLAAKHVCTLCFWLSKANVGGTIAELAVHPDRSSGQFSKHFDLIVGLRGVDVDDDFMKVDVPTYERSSARRVVREMPVFTPLEAIAEEIGATPDLPAKLDASIANGELPPKYFQHVVKTGAPDGVRVYPCVLYIDGLGFQRTDGLIRMSVKCLITNVNHLCIALRKSELCACGCRGWCTMYVAMLVLNQSFSAMARGLWYEQKHDCQAWSPTDWRSAKAGQELGWRAMILFARCDMMEFSGSFGFPGHASHEAPCPTCFCNIRDMYKCVGLSAVRLPWTLKSLRLYLDSCAACETTVTVTPAQRRQIRMSLRYDKRSAGSRGRALCVDVPELALKAGDRLEPTPTMPDVAAAVDNNSPADGTLTFWRRSNETITLRRNPIFSDETGITPDVFVPDWLHCLSLGIYKRWINWVWHALFDSNAFNVDRVHASTADSFLQMCVALLKEQLFQWYGAEKAAGRNHARVQTLTPGMVGESADSELGSWGAETNGLLFFTEHLLEKYGACLEPLQMQRLVRGTSSLVGIHRLIKTHTKGSLPPVQIQEFVDHWKTHMHTLKQLGMDMRPKHHQMAHMVNKLLSDGNPHLWSTWVDESENHELGQLALRSHRSVWAWKVLANHRRSYGIRKSIVKNKSKNTAHA
jgi:hypothetical protein